MTDLLNQRPHLLGESCWDRRDSVAKTVDFSRTVDPSHHLPPSPPPYLHQPALLGFASLDFPVNRRLFLPLWVDGGGREGPCCNPVSCCCRITFDDVCIPHAKFKLTPSFFYIILSHNFPWMSLTALYTNSDMILSSNGN